MTKREENKFSMYKGVKEVLTNNSDIHSAIPVIGEALTSFSDIIGSIDQVNFDFKGSTKGATADKIVKEETLINHATKLANVLFVFAVKTKNNVLKEEFKVSKSELEQLRDTDLLNKTNQVINSAQSYATELANYGVSETTITDAQTAHDECAAAFNAQAEKMAERSSEREKLTSLFKDADSVLYEELDPMMELFIDTNPDFYNEYQAARVIKDLGVGRGGPGEG
ncbi:MAG: hypothetical protein PVH88_08375 [Ignavibacteria bacterium]|jgi:hypothetical protein